MPHTDTNTCTHTHYSALLSNICQQLICRSRSLLFNLSFVTSIQTAILFQPICSSASKYSECKGQNTHTQHTHFYWHSKSLQSDPNQWCPTMPLLEPLVRPWIKLCPYFSNFSLMLCMCRPGRKLHNWSRPNLFCRENLPSGQPHTLARTRTKSERPEHVAGTNLQIAHHGSSFLRAVGESTRALYRFNCANAVLTQGPFQVQPVCALLVFNDMMGW